MDKTPTSQQPSRKRVIASVLVLLVLTCVIVYVFKDNWSEIAASLSQLSAWHIILLLAVGITCPLLEGAICWLLVGSRLPGFKLYQGIDTAFTGTFANVATFGMGTTPMQVYYLYRCGLGLGPGFGLLTMEYVFHKSAVLVYATVMVLWQREWIAANTTGVLKYLPLAYVVVAAIILGLVLVCVSPFVQRLARRLLAYLPKSEKWQARRASWEEQLDNLGRESRLLLADKALCAKAFGLQVFKLFLLFTLPYMCVRFMGLGELTFWQVQLLGALMMFLSNALPNLAGMGSIETSFLLVFGGFLGQAGAMSALMLYRIASYYFVFLASCAGFFAAQKHLSATERGA